jgi:hypothetical protein
MTFRRGWRAVIDVLVSGFTAPSFFPFLIGFAVAMVLFSL